jgi:hypothetical protein
VYWYHKMHGFLQFLFQTFDSQVMGSCIIDMIHNFSPIRKYLSTHAFLFKDRETIFCEKTIIIQSQISNQEIMEWILNILKHLLIRRISITAKTWHFILWKTHILPTKIGVVFDLRLSSCFVLLVMYNCLI